SEESADKDQEQAGEKPAHDLCIDMVVLAGLPVGVDAQSSEYACNGSDDQYQIGKAEIPSVHFARSTVELIDAGLCNGHCRPDTKKDGLELQLKIGDIFMLPIFLFLATSLRSA